MSRQKVSVVMTVRNDAVALQLLSDRLEKQTFLPTEVVITVANSTDSTLAVARKWQPKAFEKQVIRVGQATRAEGRNIGVKQAQHPFIVFTDAGCLPEFNWLEELIKPFKTTGNQPPTQLVSGFTWVDERSAWDEAVAPFVLVPRDKVATHPLPATRNMAILKKVFEEVGGFRSRLNWAEDYELARRLAAHGIMAEFAPQARVNWQPPSNIRTYFRMIFHLTAGDVQAKTWRVGHLTMWLRYGLLLGLVMVTAELLSPLTAVLVGIALYLAYLAVKLRTLRYPHGSSYLLMPLLQLSTDLAVLSGSGWGLLNKMTTLKSLRN